MANIVAHIKLAPGENGYYDEKTNIYLNWNHPEADVPEGLDLSNLRRSVKYRRIIVTSGSLGKNKGFKQILMEAKSKRTGIPLKDLMGNTPIVNDDGTVQESAENTTPAAEEPSKPTTTIDVKPEDTPKTEEKTTETKDTSADTKATETETVAETKTESATTAKAETASAKASTETVEEKSAEDPLTTTPKSFRSLKVGGTKDITANKEVTAVKVSDEKVASAIFSGTTVTVEGLKTGNVDVTIEAGKESVVVSGVVVDA